MRPPNHLLPTISRAVSAPIPTKRTSSTAVPATAAASRYPPPLKVPSSPESVERLVLTGRLRDAARSLVLVHRRGDPVSADALVSVLKSCTDRQALGEGRQLHGHMTVVGFDHDTFVSNHLINMYGKCGSLGDAHWVFRKTGKKNLHSWNTLMACYCKAGCMSAARELFDGMSKRDSVSWNLMISGYDHHGPFEEALGLFVGLRCSDAKVDHFGASSVISACSNLRFLTNGKELHAYSSKIGLESNVHVGSALVDLYSKCMHIEDARRVFDGMVSREQFTWNSMLTGYVECSTIDEALTFFSGMMDKNVVSWTTIIAGCSQHDRNEEAIGFFCKMRESGLQCDQVTFVSVLNACVGLLEFEEGCKIHGLVIKSGYETNIIVGSVLVALYAKCGSLDDARSYTDIMPSVDDFSWSVLIAEYAKHGQLDCSCELFEGLEVKSVALWNALITGYSELGLYEEALKTFKEMLIDGIKGDDFTYGSLLKGSDLFGVSYGRQLHSQCIKAGVSSSAFVASTLIDMYCCFFELESAQQVFNTTDRHNLVLWNAMIFGYGQNNSVREAVNTFQLMRVLGMKPDNFTFSSLLGLCSSLLALAEGTQVHGLAYKSSLESDVVVGSATVDMYAKCGNVELASLAFYEIHRHSVVSWTALLGGYVRCGMWDNATELFDKMPERNVVSWNVMLSGHAQHGSGSEGLKLYSLMNKSGTLPDRISFLSLLTICCNLLLKEQGKQVHAQVIKTGYYMNAHVSITLTNMYQKLGKLLDREDEGPISTPHKPGNVMDTAESDALSWNV